MYIPGIAGRTWILSWLFSLVILGKSVSLESRFLVFSHM